MLEISQLRLRGMRRYHFAGGYWPRTAYTRQSGRNCGVRLALNGIPQPPLSFCDTLPDYSVILELSPNCSPFLSLNSTHSSFRVANTLFIRTFPCRVVCGQVPQILFGHVCSISPAPGLGQLTHLLYSGIPYNSVIYLSQMSSFLPHLIQPLPRHVRIDNLSGVDAEFPLSAPGGSFIFPRWVSLRSHFLFVSIVLE